MTIYNCGVIERVIILLLFWRNSKDKQKSYEYMLWCHILHMSTTICFRTYSIKSLVKKKGDKKRL